MMRSLQLFPLLLTLLLFPVLGSCADKQPGCVKPEDVLPRIIAAMQRNDKDDLAMCLTSYVQISPETAHKVADARSLTRDIQKTVIAGVKKYTAKNFATALGDMRSFFLYCWMSAQEEMMLKKGKLTILGDKATYSFTEKDMPRDYLFTQPELKAYDRLFHHPNSNMTSTYTLTLEKINGRWYETMSQKDTDYIQIAYTILTDYLPAVNQGIQQCVNAKALAKYLTEANKKFDEAMSAPRTESTTK